MRRGNNNIVARQIVAKGASLRVQRKRGGSEFADFWSGNISACIENTQSMTTTSSQRAEYLCMRRGYFDLGHRTTEQTGTSLWAQRNRLEIGQEQIDRRGAREALEKSTPGALRVLGGTAARHGWPAAASVA